MAWTASYARRPTSAAARRAIARLAADGSIERLLVLAREEDLGDRGDVTTASNRAASQATMNLRGAPASTIPNQNDVEAMIWPSGDLLRMGP